MLTRQLITSLSLLHPVSKDYESFIVRESPFDYSQLRKEALILLPGKNAHELYFVAKGMFMLYCYNEKGDELALNFFWENTFMMLPVDFYDGISNEKYYIRAIEKSEVLSISNAKMDVICGLFPEARIHLDKIRSRISLRIYDHVLLLLQQKDDRYAGFVKCFKMISARLTEYLTSCFLGICIKTINRAKRKRKA